MHRNTRFYVLVGAMLLIGFGLFVYIRARGGTDRELQPATREQSEDHASGISRAPQHKPPTETPVALSQEEQTAPSKNGKRTKVSTGDKSQGGASVEGVVVDSRGNPVPGSNVTAVLVDPELPKPRYRAAMTDAVGAFKIDGVEPGGNLLRAHPPNSHVQGPPSTKEVRVGKDEAVTGVRIVADFDPGLKISGHVRDTSGNPIVGATLRVYPHLGTEGKKQTLSGADGRYEITGLQEGKYRMRASHADYTESAHMDVEAPSPRFDVTLRGKATVEGSVVDARSGGPITEFSIVVMQGTVQHIAPGFWPGEAQSFSSPEGKFTVRAEENGAALLVRSKGYAPELQHVPNTKENQTTAGVIVRLSAGGVIDGVVTTESGEPVAGAQIYIGRMPQSWELQQHRPGDATTDAHGAFRLDSLSEDAMQLYAVHEDYAAAFETVTPLSGSTPAKVHMVMRGGATITGTVRVDGVPEAGYEISLRVGQAGYENRTTVGSDGGYTFTGVPEGAAEIGLFAVRGGAPQRNIMKQVTAAAGQVSTVDFDLASGTAIIEGSVTRGGQPIPGTTIELMIGPSTDKREGMQTHTDANGEFRIGDLPAGPAAVLVHVSIPTANFERTRSFRVELEDGEVTRLDAKFDGTGRVAGRVSGIPEGWRVEVGLVTGEVNIPNEGDMRAAFMSLVDRIAAGGSANADGTFQIDDVDAGTYTFIAVASDSVGQVFTHATEAVTVTENEEASVNLTLP